MKIELTKKEYKDLVTIGSIAVYVLEILGYMLGGKEGEQYKAKGKSANNMRSKLLEQAVGSGCEDWVEKFEGKNVASDKLYDDVGQIMEDYDDFVLYNEIANKLAWRDFYKDNSKEEIKEMKKKNGGYFGVEIYDYEKKYWDEFEENDLNRLRIEFFKKDQ